MIPSTAARFIDNIGTRLCSRSWGNQPQRIPMNKIVLATAISPLAKVGRITQCAPLVISIILTLFLLTGCMTSKRHDNTPKKISVLIVDGMNNHDWERGTKLLKAILE